MKIKYLSLYLLTIIHNVRYIHCFEPFTLATYAIGAVAIGYIGSHFSQDDVKKIATRTCQFVGYCEGCEDRWIVENMNGLEVDLKSKLYGQPLAIETVLSALKHHFRNKKHPTKALTLSFHGPPGSGKTFMSNLILKNLFKLGGNSNYVYFFRGSIDFPVKNQVWNYKIQVRRIVEKKVEECNRSIFVFDEVDKMPSGVLDILRVYLDTGAIIDGVDYRNAIFIFLSNLGTGKIIEKTLELWQEGKKREEYTIADYQDIIMKSVYNEEGGFYGSNLIKSFVINAFVPFLPMEKIHIRQCLETEIAKMGQPMTEELFKQVVDMLSFGPEGYEKFAVNGCKLIMEKAGLLVEKALYRRRKSFQRDNE